MDCTLVGLADPDINSTLIALRISLYISILFRLVSASKNLSSLLINKSHEDEE